MSKLRRQVMLLPILLAGLGSLICQPVHAQTVPHVPSVRFEWIDPQDKFAGVENGKPEPDLYLAAVKELRIDAASSIAVEDTKVGADAAAAAGLRTVIVNRMGLATGSHPTVSEVDADMLLLWLGLL